MYLIVDKPKGISSFGVIKFLKKFYLGQKIGHSGTLDPNATGLMILAIGKDTKNLEKLIGLDKTYVATVDFSKITDTWDIEYHNYFFELKKVLNSLVIDKKSIKILRRNSIIGRFKYFFLLIKLFIYKILSKELIVEMPDIQKIKSKLDRLIPLKKLPLPNFSAKKVKGKRLYKIARKGKKIKKYYKKMKTYSYEVLEYNFPIIKIKFDVGSGTYIRSIAYRLGKQFSFGGILTDLRRLSIGKIELSNYKMKGFENSFIKYFDTSEIL